MEKTGGEMTEMEERVRIAITASARECGVSFTGVDRVARAAIAAMREPTPEMVDAGRSVTATWLNIEGSGLTIAREKMKLRFQAMIDAALVDKEPTNGDRS